MNPKLSLPLILSSMAPVVQVHANAPCDASVPIKGCRAEVRVEGNFVVLRSSTPQCSVIEWSLDGRGRITTVIDGEERLELLTTKPEEVSIESCTQVKDLRQLKRDESQARLEVESNAKIPDIRWINLSDGQVYVANHGPLRIGESTRDGATFLRIEGEKAVFRVNGKEVAVGVGAR